MDRATILSPSLLPKRGAPDLPKNAAVYLGDEFCVNKQPSFADFAAVRSATGRAPVLLSTLLTEAALKNYASLLAECAKKAPGAEVVVNDLGLLRLLDKKYRGRFRITLGRLMTYFFDPKSSSVPGAVTDWGVDGEKLKAWEAGIDSTPVPFLRNFIERYAVERVETDNAAVFMKYADNTDVKIAFHYPLRLMAVTRFCPFAGGIAAGCKAPCGNRLLKLETRHRDNAIFAKGNAYFVKNKAIKHPRLDRLVKTSFRQSPDFELVLNKYSCPDTHRPGGLRSMEQNF